MEDFAVIGVAGFVAPRHLRAIHETGNRLVAAMDRTDSVGILDRYFPQARFFTEIERLDRHLEKLRRSPDEQPVSHISICSPNYLHDAHVRLALRLGAHAVCEKPLVVNPWNLDALAELEADSGRRVYNILQLRLHPSMVALKQQLEQQSRGARVDVCLTYVTRRGQWYHISWKGSESKSGGLAMNIGVHFFDLLMWLFGPVESSQVHLSSRDKMSGCLELARARVRWFLSVDADDLPGNVRDKGRTAFRSITLDGQEIEFSGGFEDLHTKSYEAILAGNGFGIDEARPSLDLIHQIRTSDVIAEGEFLHPHLQVAG